jgi:Amidohydrolase family
MALHRPARWSEPDALVRSNVKRFKWFSGEEDVKGRIAPEQYADFAILSADYLSVPEEQIGTIESVLTVTGGDVVYSAPPSRRLRPSSFRRCTQSGPVAVFGGFQRADEA